MTLITLITSDKIVLSDGVNPHFRPRKMRVNTVQNTIHNVCCTLHFPGKMRCVLLFVDLNSHIAPLK